MIRTRKLYNVYAVVVLREKRDELIDRLRIFRLSCRPVLLREEESGLVPEIKQGETVVIVSIMDGEVGRFFELISSMGGQILQ